MERIDNCVSHDLRRSWKLHIVFKCVCEQAERCFNHGIRTFLGAAGREGLKMMERVTNERLSELILRAAKGSSLKGW